MTFSQTLSRLVALCALALPVSVHADGFSLGNKVGSIGSFTNDALGDTHDRWQTASYQRSWIFEAGDLPVAEALELRFRGQIVSPWHDSLQPGGDRPYATALGLGAFGHGDVLGLEVRGGAELLAIGDQTGLDWVQYTAHDLMGYDGGYDPRLRNDPHVPNDFDGKLELEVARSISFGGTGLLRPYIYGEAGAETALRAGADIVFGHLADMDDRYWVRDVVTGQPLPTDLHRRGFSLIAGFDAGEVYDSYTIPTGSEVDLERSRMRARIGVKGDVGNLGIFFGQSWISEEFTGQVEPQRLGTLSVSLAF